MGTENTETLKTETPKQGPDLCKSVQSVDGHPRWARELGEETWERINELLHDGWDVPDIIRELKLPESKLRSLQIHARKYGPRRRLILFDGFKQALLKAGAELGPKFSKALAVIAEHAVSSSVKESTQQRAVDLMLEFAKTLGQMMQGDEKAEQGSEAARQ